MLTVENLKKTFVTGRGVSSDRVLAVDGVSFEVPEGKLFTLLGPSGCGKTTTLRCIAGLETPDQGEIRLDDTVFYSSKNGGARLRANERGLGMVFQSYAIWPHLSVFKNVSFPLEVAPRNKRPARRAIDEQVGEVLAIVKLDHLAGRQATDLSGGQQQRLALARALVMRPPLLLLDEPLSNLDAKLRDDMRFELKRLQREMGITSVYVTHDQVEALSMSNLIAVMDEGKIKQIGGPRDIYERPASRFVAEFIGMSNFLTGSITTRDAAGMYTINTPHGVLRAAAAIELPAGSTVTVSIRPEHVRVQEGASAGSGANRWLGTVVTRGFLGEALDHVVETGGMEVRVRGNPSLSIDPGTKVTLFLPEEECSLIPEGP